MCKFPGREMNPCHSNDPSHCSDNTGSLTCCTTRELLLLFFSEYLLNSGYVLGLGENGLWNRQYLDLMKLTWQTQRQIHKKENVQWYSGINEAGLYARKWLGYFRFFQGSFQRRWHFHWDPEGKKEPHIWRRERKWLKGTYSNYLNWSLWVHIHLMSVRSMRAGTLSILFSQSTEPGT